MNLKVVQILSLILFLFYAVNSYGQWEKINGNFGGKINDIYFHENIISIASDSGVVYSTDGQTWKTVNNGLHYRIRAFSLASIGNTIFAGGDSGIFSTTNFVNWKKISPNHTGLIASTKSVLLAENIGYIDLSLDTGKTWTRSELSPSDVANLKVASDDNHFYYGIAGTYNGLYQYKDSNWSNLPYFKIFGYRQIIDGVSSNNKIVAAITGKTPDNLAYSNDTGKTFSSFVLPPPLYGIYDKYNLQVIDTNVVVGIQRGVFITYDKGENWTKINTGLNDTIVTKLAVTSQHIYAGFKSGNLSALYRRKLTDFQGITYLGGGIMEAPSILNATYNWYLNSNLIVGENKSIFNATQKGTYKVVITYNTNTNKRVSSVRTITFEYELNDLVTNIAKYIINNSKIQINYSNDLLFVTNIVAENQPVAIFNISGKEMWNGVFYENTIHIGNLPSGIYILKIINGNDVRTKKFIVYSNE